MQRRHFFGTTLSALAAEFVPYNGLAGGSRVPIGFLRTNWSQDPFSFGSYSFLAKGSWRRHHVALGKPVGERLFFAGEATHPSYNSTVHAAYESGLLAAERVANGSAATVGIIGAGMSGMAAADALKKAGRAVIVLEARDRLGGRIWTDASLGVPLDLGASWIHGVEGNPLVGLAQRVDAATLLTPDSFIMRGGDGRIIPENEAPDWLEDVLSIQHSAGAGEAELNIWAYWRDRDYSGEDVVFPEGYAQLFDAFSSKMDVRLGQSVTSVTLGEENVCVRGQAGFDQTFDAVIVTVPLGVLKKGLITFDPPLPTDKQKAINKLGMGVLDKLYLKYDSVFWDSDVTWIATPENGLPQGQFNQWLNLYPYINEPVIMAFNGAETARDLAELSDQGILERAIQTLSAAYPLT